MKLKTKMFVCLCMFALLIPVASFAKSAEAIDLGVKESLEVFKKTKGASELLSKAAGALVFPEVYKAGMGIGGEYGEGALISGRKTLGYYSTASASIGFQFGGQKKTVIYLFMNKNALDRFRKSDGWKVGVDASVAVIALGAGASVDTNYNEEQDILAFILDQKGLMYNITLEGSKLSRIER